MRIAVINRPLRNKTYEGCCNESHIVLFDWGEEGNFSTLKVRSHKTGKPLPITAALCSQNRSSAFPIGPFTHQRSDQSNREST